MKKLLVACLVFSGCITPPPADQPSGFLLGVPLGITTKENANLQIKRGGFVPGVPPTWPAGTNLPAFDNLVTVILAGTGLTSPPEASPIHSLSLGLDVIFVSEKTLTGAPEDMLDGADQSGLNVAVAEVNFAHAWAAIAFSVDRHQLGSDPLAHDVASVPEKELDQTVFGYLIPGSTTVALPVEDYSTRLMGPEALGFTVEDDQIHALTMHAALLHTDLGDFDQVFTTRPLEPPIAAYFTLHPDFLTPAIAESLRILWNDPSVDAGTIYVSRWDGSAWSQPDVYLTSSQMGIEPPSLQAPLPVIDGLAIDAVTPGTTNELDQVMLSFTNTPEYPSAPEYQMQYFRRGTVSISNPPRRVVVRRIQGYGSLGKQMGAGRGLGDFCNADPVGEAKYALSVSTLDDFFVARRLQPDRPHLTLGGVLPMLPHSILNLWSRLELAISGFRHVEGDRVVLRTCMSWPRPRETSGTVTVRWGRIVDLRKPTSDLANLQWIPEGVSEPMPYRGRPMTFDIPLPTDGLLQRGVAPPPLPTTSTINDAKYTQARVAQWILRSKGKTYISPIAALRY